MVPGFTAIAQENEVEFKSEEIELKDISLDMWKTIKKHTPADYTPSNAEKIEEDGKTFYVVFFEKGFFNWIEFLFDDKKELLEISRVFNEKDAPMPIVDAIRSKYKTAKIKELVQVQYIKDKKDEVCTAEIGSGQDILRFLVLTPKGKILEDEIIPNVEELEEDNKQ